jgi:hypothetical protein
MKPKDAKQPWETPKLSAAGDIRTVVQQGGGKTLQPTGDSGEPNRKPKGQG